MGSIQLMALLTLPPIRMQTVQDMVLTRLVISNADLPSDIIRKFPMLLENLPHLAELIWHVPMAHAECFGEGHPMLTLRSRSLTEVSITFYQEADQMRLEMPQLQDLFIAFRGVGGAKMVSTEFLESLATHSPLITKLNCTLPTAISLSMLKKFKHLLAVEFNGQKISGAIDEAFPQSLTSLTLQTIAFDASGITPLLAALPNLKSLYLNFIPGVNSIDGWFSSSVRSLELAGFDIAKLELASHFPSVQNVNSPSSLSLSPFVSRKLISESKLRLSDLASLVIDLRGLREMRSFRGMFYSVSHAIKLILGDNDMLTEMTWNTGNRMELSICLDAPNLYFFEISGGSLTLEEINCPNLQVLYLRCYTLQNPEVCSSHHSQHTPHQQFLRLR